MVIELMKMENIILAPVEGCIEQMLVNSGNKVVGSELLAVLSL